MTLSQSRKCGYDYGYCNEFRQYSRHEQNMRHQFADVNKKPRPHAPADVARNIDRLFEICGLDAGWMDGAGEKPSPRAIAAAMDFFRKRPLLVGKYRIFPTPGGGVLCEFEARGWDYSVEFTPAGAVEMFGVEIDGPSEMDTQSFPSLNKEFLSVFDSRTAG